MPSRTLTFFIVGTTLVGSSCSSNDDPPSGTGGTNASGGTAGNMVGSAGRGGSASGGSSTAAGTGGTGSTGGSATAGTGGLTGGTGGSGVAGSGGNVSTNGGASTAGGSGGAAGNGGTSGAAGGGQSNAGSGGAGASSCTGHEGYWVDGRILRDRCCEKVVLRGVNEMVVWTGSQDGNPHFAEIAKTGANAVRIVWETAGPVSKLDAAIGNAIDNDLIPIPELHDATGDLSKLGPVVDYWVQSEVVEVINKHRANVIVNIANEAGNNSVTRDTFSSSYQGAIARIREAGIHVPLIIDGSSWGQDIDMLQAAGPALIAADPDHNLLFSVHMWWNDPEGTRVTTELNESVGANLPLLVGEFAQHAVSTCSAEPFAYKTLLSLSRSLEIGWLAWSWGGVKNSDCANDGPFDMSTDGTFDGLTGWGREVAVTDPNSIQNTSVRPRSMTSGSCQ
jgi:mannan endo-1,4-beta-mannosidase